MSETLLQQKRRLLRKRKARWKRAAIREVAFAKALSLIRADLIPVSPNHRQRNLLRAARRRGIA